MRRAREIETLLLAMYAAIPLYLTHAVGVMPLIVFHLAMGGIVVRLLIGKGPQILPARLMRIAAVAYIPFYAVDAVFISRGAIAASTHLVLFIAVYQPIEALRRDNQAQRMLTTTLIFIASLATSTDVMIVPFVLLFAFLMFRQLMFVSHLASAQSIMPAIAQSYAEPPSGRAAAFYLVGAALIGAAIFPLLPRIRSPFAHGIAGALPGSSTALSETIDFSQPRVSPADSTVVARVWMDQQASALFTPIRLRGTIYDRYERSEWVQTVRGLREMPFGDGVYRLARGGGAERDAVVQQRPQRGKLFLPVGTYLLSGLPARLYEGPERGTYSTYYDGMARLTVRMAVGPEPLGTWSVATPNYPISPAVAALARSIVGREIAPEKRAASIERYLSQHYRYVANPASLPRAMSVDDFLLRERAGHCEYFAAGMVVLLAALDVPARIAGGFYGGRFNPFTGYYVIRREDAHAWTEVWNGSRWVTFDSTPVALRPGRGATTRLGDYLVAIGDSLTFVWDRYVLTFSLGDQLSIVEDLTLLYRDASSRLKVRFSDALGNLVTLRSANIAALLALAGFLTISISRRRRPVFHLLARYLAAHGVRVDDAMTVEEALGQLRVRQPDAARALEPLVTLYEEERFSSRVDRARVAEIRRRLAEI